MTVSVQPPLAISPLFNNDARYHGAWLAWFRNVGQTLSTLQDGVPVFNPPTKPTITGSRGANAMAYQIVQALAAYGLVTDGTGP